MRVCVFRLWTLTVAFLRWFLPNWTQMCKPPNVRTSSLGVNIAPHFPYFPLKIPIFDPEVMKTHAKTKNAISALNVHESPKFPRLVRNRGRGTRWWREIFDRKSWTCELGYGADTMFHKTYFLFKRWYHHGGTKGSLVNPTSSVSFTAKVPATNTNTNIDAL